jgi:Uma2 family endonuclease
MSAPTVRYPEILDRLPNDSTLILHGISWEEYESILEDLGENAGMRISYDRGRLQVVTLSPEHESYAELIKQLVGLLSLRLRIRVLHFGSATMKTKHQGKGSEPDACFYVQNAHLIGGKKQLDFSNDPPPDVIVEVDLHHESLSKFPIYAALKVPEIWRYDGQTLTIYYLQQDHYVSIESSRALPLLTSSTLTGFLSRGQHEDQYETLLAFESWLQAQPKNDIR